MSVNCRLGRHPRFVSQKTELEFMSMQRSSSLRNSSESLLSSQRRTPGAASSRWSSSAAGTARFLTFASTLGLGAIGLAGGDFSAALARELPRATANDPTEVIAAKPSRPGVAIAASLESAGLNELMLDSMDQIGLSRNWNAMIATSSTNGPNNDLKFVIPRSAHPAFFLKKEDIVGENAVSVPEAVEVSIILSSKNGKEIVSSRDRGLNGTVLGVKGALRLAEIRKELLEKQGLTVNEDVRFIPTAMTYFLSDQGSMVAMNAETGQIVWSRRLDKGVAPIQGFDVNDRVLAVVNGRRVEVFDVNTGTPLKRHSLSSLPDGPPAIAGDQILSTGLNGRIEILIPFEANGYRSTQGGINGRLSMPMTELSESFVWGVEKQVFISLKAQPARPIFRIPTSSPVSLPPGGFGNLFVLPLPNGKVCCFSQTSGREIWEQYTGDDVVQSPLFVQVAAASEAEASGAAEENLPAPKSNEALASQPMPKPMENDPFGTPPPAAPKAAAKAEGTDPFGSSATAVDPFGAAATQDPFSGGGLAGGNNASPFGGGSETVDESEEASDSPSSLRSESTLNLDALVGTSERVMVLLVLENGQVQALDLRSGKPVSSFSASGIRKILTFASQRIYALSIDDQLVALDLKSGARLGSVALGSDWEGVTNPISDRVYLHNKNGQILCLRPTSSPAPAYVRPEKLVQKNLDSANAGPEKTEAAKPGEGEEFDPFGGAAPAGSDPFGGGADPFGGSKSNESDPFGG